MSQDFKVIEALNKQIARLKAERDNLLKACKELVLYIEGDNELKVAMYPQSVEFAKETILKSQRGGK